MKAIKPTTELEIAKLMETYREGFLHLDPDRLGSIWDKKHDPLIYVAMEKKQPIYGWSAIEKYYAALPEHVEQIVAKSIREVKIAEFADTAMAFFIFEATVKLKNSSALYRPNGRVTMVFRYAAGLWRAIHYHESALSAQAVEQANRMKGGRSRAVPLL
jgi:ketosteroid isomerase-like protein